MEKQIPPDRYIVVASCMVAGLYIVSDRVNSSHSRYYLEYEAKQVAAWLNERNTGYQKHPARSVS